MVLKVADFFCGAGGFSEGFRQMGFDIAFALDNWGPAIETHKLNHPDCEHVQMDILEIETPEDIDSIVPDTEVIIGSPPCVAFSGSNKAGKADKTLGIQLIESFFRIVAWKRNKPGSILRYWIVENVPNSEPFIKREYSFKELGLPGKGIALKIPSRHVLNAADHGAPQTRTRFFGGDYPVPQMVHRQEDWVTIANIKKALKDPLGPQGVKKIKDPLYNFSIPRDRLTDHFYDTTIEEFEWKSAKRLKLDHGFMGRMSFPEDDERPSRTIMATRSGSTREAMVFGGRRGKGGEWKTYRMPTIREVASLMSYPITYQFQGNSEGTKYKLVGNSVCPLMARALASSILLTEEGTLPNKFPPIPDTRPKMDLTGRPYNKKEPKPRSPYAKFSMHIPYLKKNGFRVDLSNRESDFMEDKVVWSCIFHSGTGKGAKWYKVDNNKVRKVFQGWFIDGFDDFEEDVRRTFKGRLPGPMTFQRIFCRTSRSKKMGPEESLEIIGVLLDKHFPSNKFEDKTIWDSGKRLGMKNKKDPPLRILAGVFACNYVAEQVNSKG